MQRALHTAPNSTLIASFPITAGAGEARPEVPAGAAADARFSVSALSLPRPVLLPLGPSTLLLWSDVHEPWEARLGAQVCLPVESSDQDRAH